MSIAGTTNKDQQPAKKIVNDKGRGKKKDENLADAKKVVVKKKAEARGKAVPGKKAAKKTTTVKSTKATTAKKIDKKITDGKCTVTFRLHFHTQFGQDIFITGDHPLLGNNDLDQKVAMQYFDEGHWQLTLEFDRSTIPAKGISYNYLLRNPDETFSYDWGKDKTIVSLPADKTALICVDAWNYAGDFNNVYDTRPFRELFLKRKKRKGKKTNLSATHIFKVKAPLLSEDEIVCLTGSAAVLGNWQTDSPGVLNEEENGNYTIAVDLQGEVFPIEYKYGVYNTRSKKFTRFEAGNNRVLYDTADSRKTIILNDGFVVLPNDTWKGAGVSIPVFSLRTENSFGTGEFTDLKLFVDWAKRVGLKMIQVLPVNDTIATHTSADSYPYAAVSAFALHPLYLNLDAIADKASVKKLKQLDKTRKQLNAIDTVDYATVVEKKLEFAREVYVKSKENILLSDDFKSFFKNNEHWLVPYAAFCYLRDKNGTTNYNNWANYSSYQKETIAILTAPGSAEYDEIAFYYFLQYHLHLQLKDAAVYANRNGVILKGDIAIGVSRYSADTWQEPALYNDKFQAGAPPDDFAVTGQNWGFPTYNWQRMQENGYTWWKQRFEQMRYYFDAFRIDHILGFFRIWSVPINAVQGIMGRFVPAIPVHITAFHKRGISFDVHRYTKPFITNDILEKIFDGDSELVKSLFLVKKDDTHFELKPEFSTQRLVETHFHSLEKDEHHKKIEEGLYALISNVILFEADESDGMNFHFRFGIESTSSFNDLPGDTKHQLMLLYNHYFYEKQDDLWRKQGLQKLPALKRVTNMLVCGEDLGLVPACVPDVMKQLGLLSLEIQRMPKNAAREFFHPNDAPFLSVVTPSTHDMSTIRGWWEEDSNRTQQFYNNELGHQGAAPRYCEAWINRAIILQHLYSPAMWSVFLLQDLLGMDEDLRRNNPEEERINIPADPNHYWRYRMHLTIEQLIAADTFNTELKNYITTSNR